MKRFLLTYSLILTTAVIGYAAKQYYYRHRNIKKPKTAPANISAGDYMVKTQLYKKLPVQAGAIVMLGDSHTDYFPISLLHKPVVKEGIAGETSDSLLRRLDLAAKAKPQKVFLMIGHNDLSHSTSPTAIVANIRKVAARFPYSKIYITNLFPSGKKRPDGKAYIPFDIEVNRLLKAFCDRNKITYIDMFSILRKGDGINPDYDSGDHLHLSYNGDVLWAEQINKYL